MSVRMKEGMHNTHVHVFLVLLVQAIRDAAALRSAPGLVTCEVP
jgi:hypothetical protein